MHPWQVACLMRRVYNKDQGVIQQVLSGDLTTRIRRLYNKDQEVISRIFLVLVLLSASVQRCFVSRMRDFCLPLGQIRSYHAVSAYFMKLLVFSSNLSNFNSTLHSYSRTDGQTDRAVQNFLCLIMDLITLLIVFPFFTTFSLFIQMFYDILLLIQIYLYSKKSSCKHPF